jgi:hypothetical protein
MIPAGSPSVSETLGRPGGYADAPVALHIYEVP